MASAAPTPTLSSIASGTRSNAIRRCRVLALACSCYFAMPEASRIGANSQSVTYREGDRATYRVDDINDDVTRRRGPLRELTQDRESEPPAPERPRNEP